ncbi:MAG: peptidoglycan-binding protein [Alphaproteobacteria bacterium]|nr:peptidoglycan-binding protein [Alphaproteobacteria bacterium]
MITKTRTVGLAGIALASFTATTTAATALPDLVINTRDSQFQAGGCGKEQAIVTGRVAIKNQGSDVADVNVADRLTRSMLVVYVPENIDMIDKRPERQKLEPFDQQGIAFSVGEGIVKRGRNFTAPSASNFVNDSTTYGGTIASVRAVQNALLELGFDPQGVDGVLGGDTRSAIRDFQESIGATRTGTLTLGQQNELFKKAGVTGTSGTGAQGETEVTIYVSVDPYNIVEESDEANNLWSFKVVVDCN